MSTIMIQDLSQARELDRRAMSAVRGGTGISSNPWLQGKGPVGSPTVNVNVNQNIEQWQYTNVEVLKNIGVLGTTLGPLAFDVSPTQSAANTASV
ncbi:MAG: hypothetical protein EPN73_14930 [Paraburkholderia sp.]|jgi:hypothetical protein|uniref:hypothetical protein n=1 Tax=Paraburkholderia sp. TaxID=1926495 RepID=UPI00121C1928|nr:hypothetical protein [Paraburkholderia sp.]TAL95054.1 MAG: hypothetical protein EPN73_14930 [Paraburkholderia sp.]